MKTVELSATGGGMGGGWWFVARWIPVGKDRYELRYTTDESSEEVIQTSKVPLTWRAVVQDVLTEPRLQIGGYECNYPLASVAGLPLFAAELVKMACCRNEDDEPMEELPFLLEQTEEFLKKFRRSVGVIYGERSQKSIARLRSLLEIVGEDQDALEVGTRYGWSIDQSMTKLASVLRRAGAEMGHERAWARIPPDRTKIFWWLDDPIRGPRSADEFELMLEVWLGCDPKPEFDPHRAQSQILASLAGSLVGKQDVFRQIQNHRPELLRAFRDQARALVSRNYRPGERPPVGPAGILGYRWSQWGRAHDVMQGRLWDSL